MNNKKKKATVRISLPPTRPHAKDTIRISLPPDARPPIPPPEQGIPTSDKAPMLPPQKMPASPPAKTTENIPLTSGDKPKEVEPKPSTFSNREREDKSFPDLNKPLPNLESGTGKPPVAIAAPDTQPIIAKISPAPEFNDSSVEEKKVENEPDKIMSVFEKLNMSTEMKGQKPILLMAIPFPDAAETPVKTSKSIDSTESYDKVDMILSIVAAIITIGAAATLYFGVLGRFPN